MVVALVHSAVIRSYDFLSTGVFFQSVSLRLTCVILVGLTAVSYNISYMVSRLLFLEDLVLRFTAMDHLAVAHIL